MECPELEECFNLQFFWIFLDTNGDNNEKQQLKSCSCIGKNNEKCLSRKFPIKNVQNLLKTKAEKFLRHFQASLMKFVFLKLRQR